MKKLSVEEKAKAYDEALETARKINSGEGVEAPPDWTICEVIFPQLKESGDERIRKWIIDDIRYNMNNEPLNNSEYKKEAEKAIAWLEKQKTSEEAIQYLKENHSPSEISDFQAAMNIAVIKAYNRGMKDGRKIHNIYHSDKVEPKFQNGQWIVWQNKCYKVNYNGCGYELIDKNGLSTSLEYGTVDENAHLWDITKDAKDGDVLWHSDSASNGIFIFKEIRYDGKVLCYCDYDSEDHFCTGEYHTCCWSNDKFIKPATKEQCNHLFEKMREAGYEWDTEKKELKRIKKVVESKWTEEDEKNWCGIMDEIEANKDSAPDYDIETYDRFLSWLESLKQRISNNSGSWHDAQGDVLPEIDKEVIVLTQPYPLEKNEYAVSFAHRPYQGKYYGKSLITGNIETYENKVYNGWNIPDVKWWMDINLP